MTKERRFVDKYRPRRLSQVVGQRGGVAVLEGLLRDKKVLGNTILISGPYGTGKTTLARIVARTVNCLDSNNPTVACGKCRSCKATEHPDIAEINAADSRGIDEVRKIIELSKFHPSWGHGRIYILDELHQLTGPASQAFLKDLEEPPAHVSYILATTEPWKLLPTIRSRSIKVNLSEIRTPDLAKFLGQVSKAENLSLDVSLLTYIAELSGGHARDALQLLERVSAMSSNVSQEEAKEQIENIAQELIGESPSYLVPKYVSKLLSGAINPIIYVRKVENTEYLLGLVIKFMKDYLIFKTEPKMIDDKSIQTFDTSMATLKCKVEIPQLIKAIDFHLDALRACRSSAIDPMDAIDMAIHKSALVFRS